MNDHGNEQHVCDCTQGRCKGMKDTRRASNQSRVSPSWSDGKSATHLCVGEFRDAQDSGNPDDAQNREDEKDPTSDDGRVEQKMVELRNLIDAKLVSTAQSVH